MPKKDDLNLNEEELRQFVEKNLLKVRDCSHYRTEYKQCKSLSGRLHQYFVDGEFQNCSDWKEDMKICENPFSDIEAYASIIKHEDERFEKRMKGHLANDVWEKRDKPPENWESELPSFLVERQTKVFDKFQDENKSTCSIL